MPSTITLAHVLLAMAAIDAAVALAFLGGAQRHAGHGRGTPGYARARTSRRASLYAFAAAAGFALLALTPAGDVVLVDLAP
ncbi:hypothetical protein [Sphingosinicella terrae]|uniref:hypothetical protein n=1 Tax=Sphingosinicella terrae TaxID=2172047 RepID=UPI000E0D7419|nr:hypothetical protein [Sphingosinicella terrae]